MADDKTDAEGALDSYRAKRTGGATPEPMANAPGGASLARGSRMYVIHQHDATRMHWDLRLEIDGVLCSWAVPKPPSMDPDDKRLAVKVENHPLEYVHFEAVIPDGNYGAGPMIAWDRGLFRPIGDPAQGMLDGEIKFELYGYKLRGAFTLVHTGKGKRGQRAGRGSNDWLLIKKRDDEALAQAATGEPVSSVSVLSGLTVEELAAHAPRHAAVLAELATLGVPERVLAPDAVEPMLCHTADAPFSSDDWVFELKYDGYRLLAFGGAGQARLRYRSGLDPTERFPELMSALRAQPIGNLVLDGEIVMFDADGKPDFLKLAARAQLSRASEIQRAALATPVSFMAFDLLAAGGYDLRGLPLLVRKSLLARIVPRLGPIRYADHIAGAGEALLAQVVARGLEGVVAKKADSPYRATRSRDWLKMKRDLEADFAICGYTRPKASRAGLGALHLCVRAEDAWLYAGKVGSGFDDAELVALAAQLEALPKWKPTFPLPEGSSDATWVEPALVCQVRYREWTAEHSVRHPVFVRMRPDKAARDCTMPIRHTGEEPPPVGPDAVPAIEHDVSTRELRMSNPKKVFWPADVAPALQPSLARSESGPALQPSLARSESGPALQPSLARSESGPALQPSLARSESGGPPVTKGELVAYYRAIAPWLLPYLADRPTVLTRFPDGITGEMFYQKDMPDWTPPWLRTTALWSEHSQREIHYVLIDDADGLAYVANLASIPIHCWASRIADLERPDWTIVDLDPKNAPREHVVPLALAIHALCEQVGLPNYVKTSGQTGLHVLIPLGGQCTFEQARTLAFLIGSVIERQHPTMATTLRNPNARGGKVYLDWGQNAHGQLLVAPYSVRPVAGAPVSMPLVWDEVVPGLDAKRFNLRNALERVTAWTGDPMLPVLRERPDLGAALDALALHVKE